MNEPARRRTYGLAFVNRWFRVRIPGSAQEFVGNLAVDTFANVRHDGVEAFPRDAGLGLVCYSLGNFLFHPLATPAALRLEGGSRAYLEQERPENRETCVARFELTPAANGRLAIAGARLQPAALDESGEARAATPDEARRIADRVARFCAWRNTPVETEGGAIVWRRPSIAPRDLSGGSGP